MSGDVQPRKRKDKKKKRDDEASHGVHLTKMGSEDVHLHVHHEHGTGGHWCAKIIFFSLMTVLLGLVCLIILENRGISDVDTPLSESRFSNYFDGWVDEHRADDHHGDVHGSPEEGHDDDDDHDHDEPLEEEADVSEGDEADEDENVTQEEAEEADHDEDDEEDENATAEDENATAEEENATAEDENVTAEDEEEDENVTAEEENVTAEEEDEDNATVEATTENVDEDDEEEDEEDNNTQEDNVDDNITRETSKHVSENDDEDDDPFDDDEDDGNFDSVENIVDNDASELELLKEKARLQAAAEAKNSPASTENDNNSEDDAEQVSSWASSLILKIGVGLALALVARLVLLKKNPITNHDEPDTEVLLKRRLTIASPEEAIPDDPNDMDELLPEDEFSEEEIEIEEEIEYIDDIEEEQPAEENEVDAGNNDYKPETFEQLNAMYRPKGYQNDDYSDNRTQATTTEPGTYRSPYQTSINTSATNNNNNNTNTIPKMSREEPITTSTRSNTLSHTPYKAPAVFEAPPPPPLIEAKIDVPKLSSPPQPLVSPNKVSPPRISVSKYSPPRDAAEKYSPAPPSKKDEPEAEEPTKKDVTYDMDYQPEEEDIDIDYDEDDIYDEGHDDDDSEELDDDDLDEEDDFDGDEEDLSDVDDTELMSRLEAKYGKLPAKEYESDEDPDDPTWTQIKPKTGGGPQSYDDNDDGIDLFEQEFRRANEEMMREALSIQHVSMSCLSNEPQNCPMHPKSECQYSKDCFGIQHMNTKYLKSKPCYAQSTV